MKQHKTPCRECPFRVAALPGYVGNSTPLEFIQVSETGARMPCHMRVNYESPDWKDQQKHAPQCAGHSIYMRNRCKVPRQGAPLVDVKEDREKVFTNPQGFLDHHCHGKAPRVICFGDMVHAQD